MENLRQAALDYAHDKQGDFIEDLGALVAIPSVSMTTENKADMSRAADWLVQKLKSIGMQKVRTYETGGHPVVYGEWLEAGPDAPTILVYGHYDVQPADPLDLWDNNPYQATKKGELLFGRGVTDNKGPMMGTILAVEAVKESGGLEVNIKFLIEGEEEMGSTNLETFVKENTELLACDMALNPDAGMIATNKPTITYGLRGLAYFEVRVYGASQDLHSGLYGGAVHNPAQVLCELIAGMHDEDGVITLPGFYDSVRPMSAEERAELARLPTDEEYYRKMSGVSEFFGEKGYTIIERIGGRPTLEVNGLLSGYTGEGTKTVLPAEAMAKVSCRLVPDQVPDRVFEQLKAYLAEKAPPTVRVEAKILSRGMPAISDRHSVGVEAMSDAMEEIWGTRPLFRREGGTIPVVGTLQKYLGAESVNMGSALPEDNMHAPNERTHLPTLFKSIDAIILFLLSLGKRKGSDN